MAVCSSLGGNGSQDNYIGHADYYGSLHQKDVEFRRGTSAMCLTGLAGIGKSELLRALGRVMPSARRIVTKDGMQVPLESYRLLKLEVCANPNDLLRKFCGVRGTGDELKKTCRRFAFRNGISFVLADEFQFTALSSGAGAQITKMLLSLDTLGIPLVYSANFSMLHTLRLRNQQELQRLTTDITEVTPDTPDSNDWLETLVLLKDVAPETFVYDPVADAGAIHALCGGIKRALARLLEIAYASVHEKGAVGMDELARAYRSRNYSNFREDVTTILHMTTETKRKRKDLWNPFRPVDEMEEAEQRESENRQVQLAHASLLAAMNRAERKEYAKVARQEPAHTETVRKADKVSLGLTAEDLTRNLQLFRDGLVGD